MAITQYRDRNWLSPWREFDQVSNRLSRLFGNQSLGDLEGSSWLPAVNIEETKDELLLTAELPGLRREDVEIELENSVLAIRGRKEAINEEKRGSQVPRVGETVWELSALIQPSPHGSCGRHLSNF